jgi:hypothetical protein
LLKVPACYQVFKELTIYYAGKLLSDFITENKIKSIDALHENIPAKPVLNTWKNIGGQLIPETELNKLIKNIHSGKIKDWKGVHDFYQKQGNEYPVQKLIHALAAALQVRKQQWRKNTANIIKDLLLQSVTTREWMTTSIYKSREKDYKNPFRKMVYESTEEMNKVIGPLQKNAFINQEKQALELYKKTVRTIIKQFAL